MEKIHGLRRFLRLPRPLLRQVRQDVEAELRFHLEMRTGELIDQGWDPSRARDRAEDEFGDLESTRKYMKRLTRRREGRERSMTWLHDVMQDLRYGFRLLNRSRGFTATVLVTIGLGVGATTAIFSVVNAVLLKPFPFEDPDRLVMVWETNHVRNYPYMYASPPNFADWRNQNEVFEELGAFASVASFFDSEEGSVRIQGAQVTAGTFPMLGIQPQLGRWFTAEEDTPGSERVVVLSDRLWRSLYGGDEAIQGRTILLDDEPTTVVGVMPAGFDYPPPVALEGPAPTNPAQFWVPAGIPLDGSGNRGAHYLRVVARLRDGVSVQQAEAQTDAIARRIEQTNPGTNTDWETTIVPLDAQIFGDVRTPLLLLLGAVGFVLLIACVNIANLLLARGTTRQQEFATRASLGAGRGRILRQLLGESMLLGLLGGLVGLVLAWVGVKVLLGVAPSYVPRMGEAAVDLRVAGFGIAVAVIAGLLFGLAPAAQGFATDLAGQMREAGRTSSGGRASSRFRSGLVVVEVALALMLLVGAGLLIRSFAHLRGIDPGFSRAGVTTMRVSFPRNSFPDSALRSVRLADLLPRIRALPGVEAAGMVLEMPLTGDRQGTMFAFEGETELPEGEQRGTNFTFITPGYFEAMQVPLLRGRLFSESDDGRNEAVIIINQRFADAYFQGRDPIGQRLHVGFNYEVVRRIVGIAGNTRHATLTDEINPGVYAPYYQVPWGGTLSLAVRSSLPEETVVATIRGALLEEEPTLKVYGATTVGKILADSVARPRFTTLLVGLFSFIALLLAAVGIYGVIRYNAGRRSHEIGVRIALGAGRGEIVRLVMRQGILLVGIGLALGSVGAILTTSVLNSQLYGVRSTDPITFLGVALVLAAVASLATYLPAHRATRLDPVRALRQE